MKFFLGNNLGLPVITPQYNFSIDRKNITANFFYNELVFDDNSFDFVLSAGVLHHVDAPLNKTIEDHSRVLKPGGLFFIFLVGEGGMELEIWNFCEKLLTNVPIDYVYERFKNSIHHLRLQGILDHSFSSYFQTNRNFCEKSRS